MNLLRIGCRVKTGQFVYQGKFNLRIKLFFKIGTFLSLSFFFFLLTAMKIHCSHRACIMANSEFVISSLTFLIVCFVLTFQTQPFSNGVQLEILI